MQKHVNVDVKSPATTQDGLAVKTQSHGSDESCRCAERTHVRWSLGAPIDGIDLGPSESDFETTEVVGDTTAD